MEDEKAFLARTVWRVGLDMLARRPSTDRGLEDEAGREFAAGGESAGAESGGARRAGVAAAAD